MDLQKLELLVKKINHTVKLIEKFKENEKKLVLEIKKLTEENIKLQEENLNLKKEVNSLKEDVNKNSVMRKELEEKILEIIRYLPEDEEDEEEQKTVNIQDEEVKDIENPLSIVEDENEEEALKKFVTDDTPPEKSLFKKDESQSVDSQKIEEINKTEGEEKSEEILEVAKEAVDSDTDTNEILEKNNVEGNNDGYELKFGSMLFDEEEESDKEINFNFEEKGNNSESSDEDLPKGVL
ncbi:MAG TPA: hypothetical protein PLO89_01910 [Spirochaetota bacterium]|nr:hypothetical protein [Spirochaetota bacterium]